MKADMSMIYGSNNVMDADTVKCIPPDSECLGTTWLITCEYIGAPHCSDERTKVEFRPYAIAVALKECDQAKERVSKQTRPHTKYMLPIVSNTSVFESVVRRSCVPSCKSVMLTPPLEPSLRRCLICLNVLTHVTPAARNSATIQQ